MFLNRQSDTFEELLTPLVDALQKHTGQTDGPAAEFLAYAKNKQLGDSSSEEE